LNEYLRAIGLGEVNTDTRLSGLIKFVSANPDEQYILGKNNSDTYVEYYKQFGERFGLVLRGDIGEKEEVTIDRCSPYAIAERDMYCSHIEIENDDGGNVYVIIAEDEQTGNELVFHLQNVLDYLDVDKTPPKSNKVNIAGLSLNGTIVLPVIKDEYSEKLRYEEDLFYRELMHKVRQGDNEAKELLKIQESETTEMMRERLKTEDFLSVVEGFFIPNENNDTCYSLLGEIEFLEKLVNRKTNEGVYRLTVNVTGTPIEIYINESDIIGMPSIGMRFLGNCWLQGRLVY
jgi:hypothetical protein